MTKAAMLTHAERRQVQRSAAATQRHAVDVDSPLALLQARANAGPHATALASLRASVAQRVAKNRTGLPDRLRAGLESLSGRDLSGIRVHYNSPKPAQLAAHAFAQCSDIHLAPGQERHLPHGAPVQRMRVVKTGKRRQLDFETLPFDELRVVWDHFKARRYEAESKKEAELLRKTYHARVQQLAQRPSREAAPKSFVGLDPKKGGKPSRRKDTEYGAQPLDLALKAVGKDKFFKDLLNTHKRATMPESFTEELVDTVRKKLKKERNPYETLMLNKRADESLSKLNVSRNHRLADSVISMVMAVSLQKYAESNKKQRVPKEKALMRFTSALAPEHQAKLALSAFHSALGFMSSDPRRATESMEEAAARLSVNEKNVRFGEAGMNTRILNNFDPNVTRSGTMTPISEEIVGSVNNLQTHGLITPELARQALLQAVDKETGEPLSSSYPLDTG